MSEMPPEDVAFARPSAAVTWRYAGQGAERPGSPAIALAAAGVVCIVVGGLVAAITGPLSLAHGSWAAAYLVLVGGVVQCAMGLARMWKRTSRQLPAWGWVQFGAWNVGNVVVIAGVAALGPWAVDGASVLLVAAIVVALFESSLSSTASVRTSSPRVPAWITWCYRVLLLLVALSVPIGMALSYWEQ